jgi:hypothetical protein
MSSQVDFATRIKKAGGIRQLASMNYSRNLWAIMKKFSSIPAQVTESGGINMLPLDNNQIDFVLWEMRMDADEENRAYKAAQKGMEIDYDNSKQYYDSDESWWNDPENNDLFAGDKQSDEDLKKQLDDIMDKATSEKLKSKLQAVKDHKDDTPSIKAAIKAQSDYVRKIANDPKKLDEYRQNQELKDSLSSKNSEEIEKESSKEQQRLFELAKENTKKALAGLNTKG